MTWIKICGTTNLEDAQLAVKSGVDALGFVFYPKSPRYITPEVTRGIVGQLPERVERVGVFVEPLDDNWVEIVNGARLTAVQVHLPADPTQMRPTTRAVGRSCFWCPIEVYTCFPASWFMRGIDFKIGPEWHLDPGTSKYDPKNIPGPEKVFLDSGTPDTPGGTGKTFDWEKAVPLTDQLRKYYHLVIAGGLTPVNVSEAVRKFRPYGVDVVSGVEATPGRKDPDKVRAFVQAVRAADKSA
jgi:phosphoribosylanthranilate isomerase